ncbi:MAG: hypothetical protein H0V88_13780 [Pyrinomonadaceae bacterium]|nr:hypothetical protein [Pyrinomonadaceae bacterium]
MGTDSIKLFDKALADQILVMERESLTRFLEDNLSALKQKEFVLNPVMYEIEENGGSIPDTLERLLSSEYTLTGLKSELAQDFAFGDEEIYLDYWGCYAEVFDGHPEGSISSLDYFPDHEEETFLLLRPDHVDQMIRSLCNHMDDLSIMNKEQIEKVGRWRDFCAANPSYMIAYQFDF